MKRIFGARFRRLARSLPNQLSLMWRDPEQLGRNLLQYTHPAHFEDRLLDVLRLPLLNVRLDLAKQPALNVVQPVLDATSMTGGPNTIVLLSALVAEQGVPVRLVTNRPGHRPDAAWFELHVASLLGRAAPPLLSLAVASDATHPTSVGADDIWLATHWTTAQALKPVLPQMRRPWFVYLVQDYEPAFYAWSSNYALALETYGMDFYAVINERFLAEYLITQANGRFAHPSFIAQRCRVFEPAVDRRVFHPPNSAQADRTRTLLFYARPTNPRNMLGLGVQALREAVAGGAFGPNWRFLAIGGRNSMPRIDLGAKHTLEPIAWQSYEKYADQLRAAELLLCPMLSPHTSYPVLEMLACGGRVVTNTYGTKTAEELGDISPLIQPASPTIEGLSAALARAAEERVPSPRIDQLTAPGAWEEVLKPIALWIIELMNGGAAE